MQQELENLRKTLQENQILKTKPPVQIRDICKVEKKNCIKISVFHYEAIGKYPVNVSTNTFERHVDLLLIGEEGKRHYVLFKDFHTSMYYNTPHRERKKHFCRYCQHAFSAAEILKNLFNNCFKVNGKQIIKMPKKGEYIRFKSYERTTKPPAYYLCRF